MNIDALVDALLEVGRSGDLHAATKVPGAGVHSQVVLASSCFRGTVVDKIAALPLDERVSFAKALAEYENSVGGIGSVTALQQVMHLFGDAVELGYETFFWITENTRSLWYYADRAVDFIEPDVAAVRRAAARAETERRNYQLAAPARDRRANRATGNLCGAVRRGDPKAVQALLAKGADPTAMTPTGEPLISYARVLGREDIVKQLEAARDAHGAA
jgi:hypothetical protein